MHLVILVHKYGDLILTFVARNQECWRMLLCNSIVHTRWEMASLLHWAYQDQSVYVRYCISSSNLSHFIFWELDTTPIPSADLKTRRTEHYDGGCGFWCASVGRSGSSYIFFIYIYLCILDPGSYINHFNHSPPSAETGRHGSGSRCVQQIGKADR